MRDFGFLIYAERWFSDEKVVTFGDPIRRIETAETLYVIGVDRVVNAVVFTKPTGR